MKTFRKTSMLISVLFSLSIFMLTSCGDKDDDKKEERSLRLRQMNMRYTSDNPQWDESDSAKFLYNANNQLIAMVGLATDDSIAVQYDSEGRISGATFLDSEGEYNTMTYSWSGNKLTMAETDYADARAVFEVNDDGRVVRMETYFLNEGQWYKARYMLYNWSEGNLVSTEEWQSSSKSGNHQMGSHHFPFIFPALQMPASDSEIISYLKNDFIKDSEVTYTYDDKINPFKDNQLYRFSEVAYYSSANNALSSVRNGFDFSGEIYETYTNNFSFTYNSENYPLVMSQSDFDWSITESYFYE